MMSDSSATTSSLGTPATSRLKVTPGVEWNRDRKEVHIGDRRESDEGRSVEVWRGRWKGGKWRERKEVRPDGLTEKIISCRGRSSPLPIRLCLHDVLRGLRHREESEMIVRWSEPLEMRPKFLRFDRLIFNCTEVFISSDTTSM